MPVNPRPLVIIHGWNDDSRSFRKLAQLLQDGLKRETKLINLADYITMDDEVTFDDIITAMSKAWAREKLATTPYSVDVVVHSTGGLVIRSWLNRFYTAKTAPIKHLVMLAPANFGSPLAHKGNAFYGRIIEGFKSKKMFNVGAKLLKALELASPYTWQLAMQDRFGSEKLYGPDKILCTVLIGNAGLTGISAAANQDGSDGVVRVASANLNCAFLNADFSVNPLKPTYTLKQSSGNTAFGVLINENHRTIAAKDNGPNNDLTMPTLMRAVEVTDNEFLGWCRELQQMNQEIMRQPTGPYYHGFQNTVVFVHDQFDFHVKDYFLEFYGLDNKNWVAQFFHGDVIRRTHVYSDDASYRSIYIDCTRLYHALQTKDLPGINVSLTAVPTFDGKNNVVGYRTFTDQDIGAIQVQQKEFTKVFSENRTLLVQVKLQREQADRVFQIEKLS
jgi:pimeloyl-ACP methyl ester carboxylesterase